MDLLIQCNPTFYKQQEGKGCRKTEGFKTGEQGAEAGFHTTSGPQHFMMHCVALTCCLPGLVTKEPGLAAWDGLELGILWGWRQALGSRSQECIKILQPCDLEDKRIEKLPSRRLCEVQTAELPPLSSDRQDFKLVKGKKPLSQEVLVFGQASGLLTEIRCKVSRQAQTPVVQGSRRPHHSGCEHVFSS